MGKLSDLALGTLPVKQFSFDRKKPDGTTIKIECGVRELTPRELDQAHVNAARYVETLDKEKTSGVERKDILENAQTIEVLAIALRDSADPKRIFAIPDLLRDTLTNSEIGLLYRAYDEWIEECGTNFRTMTPERFESLFEAVKKAGTADPLVFCDWRTRSNFTTILVAQLAIARMDSSSGTSASNPFDKSTPTETSDEAANDSDNEAIDDRYEEWRARLVAEFNLTPRAVDEVAAES